MTNPRRVFKFIADRSPNSASTKRGHNASVIKESDDYHSVQEYIPSENNVFRKKFDYNPLRYSCLIFYFGGKEN